MLPLLWLAFTAPPLAYAPAPLPVLPPEVAQRLVDPPRCLSARCVRDEWRVDAMPSIPAGQLRVDGSTLPGAGGRLRMAAMRRDWIKPQGSNARVGMQYGVQAVSSAATSLKMVVDTGYRLQGYADDGIAGTGPILRGQLEWNQVLGERAKLSQTTRIETGQHGTYLRNSLLLNLKLQPDLTLSSGVETRRDSALMGRNQTDAKVNLRYVF
ncbi:MAG: DUF481 domain-containing protein [Burkholderiaceae bacterium]|jgi:hypothetical protein|nr:MAG: DUF481 domain-containing protein [Burkholderiaceae bacterium]